ncbi:riboflavin synthase [Telopea speciosissima]|uniref:riboflavin synthase n=1 Tax=Telopea speciosissima TaxID=54955 RepID=UPI001CC4668D|nr:riboflavin synthase [Telopea speciosissima]
MAVFAPLLSVSRTSTAPMQNLILNPQMHLSRAQLRFNSKLLSSSSSLFFTTFRKSKSPIQYLRRLDESHYNPIQSLFTGIVEEMGEIKQLGYVENGGFEMKIAARTVLEDVKLGDSIAVNGTCLTVTEFNKDTSDFSVGLAPETLRKTSLIELTTGSLVNLERALQPSTRMGGHFVQGHVDSTGEIVSIEPEGDSLWVKVKTTPELLKYIVPKGFIAVDGTSLTVVSVFDEEQCFNFMLVAYTQQNVVIPLKKVGQKVNLEVDILGKYVERLLKGGS